MDDHSVRIFVRYSGDEEITNGFTMSFRIRGKPRFKSITMNNENVDYYSKRDKCSTYVFIDVERIEKNDVREVVAQF